MDTQGRTSTSEQKYKDATSLYAGSRMSIKEICEHTGVGFIAFSTYLSKYHRNLILKRHDLTDFDNVRLRGKKGQTTTSHYIYKEAIAACDSMEYIEYNISQIARIFNVAPCSLLGQLRRHYPDIVARREQQRQRMGIATNLPYGPRQCSKTNYAEAIALLQSSDMTIEEVADMCKVSYTGLREHITAYHPQITRQREEKRLQAKGRKVRGQRNGNWMIYEPTPDNVAKYEKAIELYHTTSKELKEIVHLCGVTLGGFRHYLRTWHPELMVQRRGFDESVAYAHTKRYRRATAEKYAEAIERLQSSELSTARVASEFGFNPEVFRMYVKEHHPELAESRGMVKAANGKTVSHRSAAKYAEAVHLYMTTGESLKSIAKRLGLVYNSLGGFIRRNYPEMKEKRHALLSTSMKSAPIASLN